MNLSRQAALLVGMATLAALGLAAPPAQAQMSQTGYSDHWSQDAGPSSGNNLGVGNHHESYQPDDTWSYGYDYYESFGGPSTSHFAAATYSSYASIWSHYAAWSQTSQSATITLDSGSAFNRYEVGYRNGSYGNAGSSFTANGATTQSSYFGGGLAGQSYTVTTSAYAGLGQSYGYSSTSSNGVANVSAASAPLLVTQSSDTGQVILTQSSPQNVQVNWTGGDMTAGRATVYMSSLGNFYGSAFEDQLQLTSTLFLNGTSYATQSSVSTWNAGSSLFAQTAVNSGGIFNFDLSGYAPGTTLNWSVQTVATGLAYDQNGKSLGSYNLGTLTGPTSSLTTPFLTRTPGGEAPAAVPEPSGLALYGAFAVGLGLLAVRRRRTTA